MSKDSEASTSPIWSVAFSPDGKRLAAGGYKEVRLWDLEGKTSHVIGKTSGPVRSLAWSADGTQLAAGSGQPGVTGEVLIVGGMLSGADPTPAITLKEHRDVVESVAFMPSGQGVASASIDERALVTELPSGKVLRALADHTNRVVAVAVSQGGKYLLTGSLDKTVKVWSAVDYQPLANIDANVGQVNALAFLPNGDFAVGGEDGNIRLFRLQESKTGNLTSVNGQQQRNIAGNRIAILSLAASTKGNVLVSGGADKTVGVFDLGGSRKYTLKECTDLVYSVAVDADGTWVAAGCRDGKLRVWTAKDGMLAAELSP